MNSPEAKPKKPWVTLPDPDNALRSGQFQLKVTKLDGVRHPEYRLEFHRVLNNSGETRPLPRYRIRTREVDGAVQVESFADELIPLLQSVAYLVMKDAQSSLDAYVLARGRKRTQKKG